MIEVEPSIENVQPGVVSDLPEIVWSGDGFNCLERTSDGGGEYPDGYSLTKRGVRVVADWLIDHAGSDVEDCEACFVYAEGGGNGYCPVHYGVAQGVDTTLAAVRQKLGELE